MKLTNTLARRKNVRPNSHSLDVAHAVKAKLASAVRPCLEMFESLESRRLLAASVYVGENLPTDFVITTDTAPVGLSNGDTVTWNPGGLQHTSGQVSGLTFGTNAFTSVADGTTAVDNGGTVFVEAGLYPELVTVNKRVTYLGAQAGVDARTRVTPVEAVMTGNAGTSSFLVTADNVRIDGFTVQGQTNVNQFGAGIVLGAGTSGAGIRNNIVQNNVAGLFVANSSATDQLVVARNLFRDNNNPGSATGNAIYADQFTSGGTVTNALIAENRFTGNNVTFGINITNGNNMTVSFNAFETGNALNWVNVDNSALTDNTFTGQLLVPPASFQRTAINLSGSDNAVVDGNTMTNRLASAVSVFGNSSNLTLTDNTVTQDVTPFAVNSVRAMISLTSLTGTSNISRNTVTLTGTMPVGAAVNGIAVQGNNTNTVNVTANVLNGGNTDAPTGTNDSHGIGIFGSGLGLPSTPTPVFSTVNATNNFVNGWVDGVASPQSLNARTTVRVNENDLSGNSGKTINAATSSINVLDGSANWHGSNVPAVVASRVVGRADYTPSLDFGTDTSAAPGFQGDFSSLTVHAASLQTGTAGRIQEAVTLLADGALTGANRKITATSGSYPETAAVNKSVMLLGAQAGVDARGRSGPESVITSPTNDATLTLLNVTAPDVKIDGFTIDGDNPAITGGTPVVGGGDANARRGMRVLGVQNVLFQNNRVMNFNGRGVQYEDAASVNSTGTVTQSVFDNIGDLPQADGFALLAFDSTVNFTNNDVTDTNFGPWYQFIYTGTGSIGVSGNNVSVQGIGIGLNETGGNAGAITVANNTFTVAPGGLGAQVWSVANAGGAAFNANTFTGGGGAGSTGVTAWTGTGTMSVPFNGGSISGFETGVEVINEELSGPFGLATAPANITLNGVALTAAPGGTAVRVIDTPAGTMTASVTLVGGTTITGSSSGTGVLLDGALARFGGDSLGNTSFAGFTGTSQFVELDNGAYAGDEINGTGATYNGTPGGPGVTTAQGFAIEDRITHGIDRSGVGLVRVKPGHVFVTPNSFAAPETEPSIQRGVDMASDGDTVNVAAGTYAESVTIPKSVIIDGEGNGPTPLVTWTSDSSNPLANITTADATDDVTFLDIAFDATNGANTAGSGIRAYAPAANFDALTVDRSTFTDFAFDAIDVSGDATNGIAPRNVVISNSSFTNNGSSGGGGAGDISLFQYNGDASLSNLTLVGNSTGPIGARLGIQLRGVGAGTGAGVLPMGTVALSNVDVSGNYGTQFIGFQRYGNVNNLSFSNVQLGGATSNITRTFGALLRFDAVGAGTVASPAMVDLGDTYFRGLSNTSPVPFFLEFAPDNNFTFLRADATDTRWNLSSGTGVVASAMTLPQAFEATDRILDYADPDAAGNPFKGWAELQNGRAFNTPISSNISHTVDVVDAGGTIFVKEGTYTQLVTVDRSVTLKGAQAGVDPRPGRPGPETIMNNPGGSFNVIANDVVIDGFTVRDANTTPLNTGIYLSPNFSGYQILNNIITNNTFGMYLNSQGTTQTAVRHNLFNANNQAGPGSGNAIYADAGSKNVLVEENRFTGHASAAMVFTGATPGINADITVNNNQMVNDNSIVFFNTTNVDITNNTSTNSQGSVIFLGGGNSDVTITGNTASAAPTRTGVNLADPATFGMTPNSNVTIAGNSFTGLLNGIRASTNSTSDVVQITGNTLNANTNGVRVDGGNVNITGDNDIAINAGAGVLVETGGVATITGNNSTGIHDNVVGIDVAGGTVTIDDNVLSANSTAAVRVRNSGTATIGANTWSLNGLGLLVDSGTATITATQRIDGVSIGNAGTVTLSEGDNVVLTTTSLTTAGSGRFDIRDNAAIIDYTGASPIASIFTRLQSGYAGGAWNGPGIMSQTAANDAQMRTGVGYAEATDIFGSFPATFEGQPVDGTSVLLKYTLYGDADLNGNVNLGDFNRLAANFGQSPRRWSQGDFTFDQNVNLADFNRLAANFGMSVAPGAGVTGPSGDEKLPSLEELAKPAAAIKRPSSSAGEQRKAGVRVG